MNVPCCKIGFVAISAIMLTCLPLGDSSAQAKQRMRAQKRHLRPETSVIETGQRIKIEIAGQPQVIIDGVFMGKNGGFLEVRPGGPARLDSLTAKDSVTYVFCGEGAVYDPDGGLVSGSLADGRILTMPLAEIDHVHVTLPDDNGAANMVFSTDMVSQQLKLKDVSPRVSRVPVDSIAALYVWQVGKSKATMRGIGAVTGLTIGIIIGYSSYNSSRDDIVKMPVVDFVLPALVGMIAGGALFAALAPNEGWEKISIEDAKFSVTPIANGSPGLTVTFRIP